MKKLLKMMALTFTAAVLFTGCCCCKEDDYANTYFYVNEAPCGDQLKLYIDDEYRGELPYINNGNTCGNERETDGALSIPVKSKSYKAEARDAKGNVIAGGAIRIKSQSAHATGCKGQIGITRSPGSVVVYFARESTIQNAE